MPNVWKFLTRPKVEAYQFPDAAELKTDSREESPPPPPSEEEEVQAQAREEPEEPEEPETNEVNDPISYAQIQADRIMRDAGRQAQELLEKARRDAGEESRQILEDARRQGLESGRAEGYAQGLNQALEEGRKAQAEQAEVLQAQVQEFLDQAGAVLDRQMDDNREELRDLAIAIAEKVVSVSLKSSADVICRMIQAAVDKRKRREWAHIYIAECDAKNLVKVPASLMTALSSLSDRVRIIPMADDEAGTCIIEMPDEIIDASAATQLNNIRTMLSDTPTGAAESGLNFSGGFHVP